MPAAPRSRPERRAPWPASWLWARPQKSALEAADRCSPAARQTPSDPRIDFPASSADRTRAIRLLPCGCRLHADSKRNSAFAREPRSPAYAPAPPIPPAGYPAGLFSPGKSFPPMFPPSSKKPRRDRKTLQRSLLHRNSQYHLVGRKTRAAIEKWLFFALLIEKWSQMRRSLTAVNPAGEAWQALF